MCHSVDSYCFSCETVAYVFRWSASEGASDATGEGRERGRVRGFRPSVIDRLARTNPGILLPGG